MNNRQYLLVIVFLVISLNSYCVFRWINIPTGENVRLDLKTGDIVLRKGKGLISQWYAGMSQRDPYFSHAGIVLNLNDTVRIISCTQDHEPSGLICEMPDQFLNHKIVEAYSVYRPAFTSHQLQRIMAELQNDLLHPYPFDSNYELNERKSYYCTEYIYQMIHRIAPEVNLTSSSIDNWNYIAPDDLYVNAGFELVYSTRKKQ